MSLLKYQNLSLSYNDQEILHHIDLIIPKNQITVIVGQSGSGKSTLLKATMGLLSDDAKITDGKILFEENDLLKEG
ncbi:MAG: ATP-binding cassette domain-containing protein, partial [Coprobacillus sp.]|nr:ATP-binding cassette domain-containing protein [Coprobacillus sp.]